MVFRRAVFWTFFYVRLASVLMLACSCPSLLLPLLNPLIRPNTMSAMKPLNRRAALSALASATLASATLASASLLAIRPLRAQTPNVPDAAFGFEAVSYTHLTLPTIYSV